jgi:hypothetical protein
MPGKFLLTLAVGEIGTHVARQRGALNEPRHLLVRQPLRPDPLAIARQAPKERTMANSRELQPRLQREHGAGRVR